MTTYHAGLSEDRKTVYLTIAPEELPEEVDEELDDIEHVASGAEADDTVDASHGENHVLYHDVQELLYHEDIFDMQSISIVKSGNIWNQTGLTIEAVPDLDASDADTHTLVIEYAPSGETADNDHFTYASSVPGKATVSAAGVITAVSAGATVITVTQANSGLSKTVNVTVVA